MIGVESKNSFAEGAMYFVIVKEICTGKIIDKVELSTSGNQIDNLLTQASAARKQFANLYPPESYAVTFEEADNWEQLQTKFNETSGNGKVFTMIGSHSSFLMINILTMIIGTVLLFIFLIIRLLYNPFLFIIGIMILFAYCFFDFKRWLRQGIQMVKIDEGGITIYRGSQMKATRIEKKNITDINVFKKLNRRIVNILLSGYVDSSIPGVAFFSGPKVKITNDAFNNNEFNVFIQKAEELARR